MFLIFVWFIAEKFDRIYSKISFKWFVDKSIYLFLLFSSRESL